jgi:flagellar L-ring protein precursor FlgH
MTKKILAIIMILMCVSAIADDCLAGSIWAKRNLQSKPLYSDDKAFQVGDILTIIVKEELDVETETSRDLSNRSKREINFTDDDELYDKFPFNILPRIPGITENIQAESSKSQGSSSDYEDKRTIEDRITVVVEDVHPNGNLVVIGTRIRNIARDSVTIQLSGIVRPRDVSFDNTIRSEQIANFKLVTINDGVSENYNQPGWLARILDGLWPF